MKDFSFSALDHLDDGQVFGVPLAGRPSSCEPPLRLEKSGRPTAGNATSPRHEADTVVASKPRGG